MITSNPAENPLIAALANTAGQESSNAPRLTEGVAYHPGPSASVNPTIAKSGSSSHLPVQLAAGVETRFGGPSAFRMDALPEHKKIRKWIDKAKRDAKLRNSERSRYSQVYLDNPKFAEAAFKSGLGPILHFAALDGSGIQAEDAEVVWARTKSQIESGESSQFGSNHVSRQGIHLTPNNDGPSSSAPSNPGKGDSGKRKSDDHSDPGAQGGKGKKGKK